MLQMKKPLLGHLVYSWAFLSPGPDSGSRDYRGSAPLYSSWAVHLRVSPLEGLLQRADKKGTSQSGGRVRGERPGARNSGERMLATHGKGRGGRCNHSVPSKVKPSVLGTRQEGC